MPRHAPPRSSGRVAGQLDPTVFEIGGEMRRRVENSTGEAHGVYREAGRCGGRRTQGARKTSPPSESVWLGGGYPERHEAP